jgi:DNA-binding transcriptional MerR regulator
LVLSAWRHRGTTVASFRQGHLAAAAVERLFSLGLEVCVTDSQKLYSVSELAKEFSLTPQALRFYEEKGLLSPKRAGTARVFDYRDRARLLLILKFRRLGFSLEDIREYLSHYRPDIPNVEQYRDGIEKIRRRLAALEQMRVEIDEAIDELKDMEKDALRRLSDCEAREAVGRVK